MPASVSCDDIRRDMLDSLAAGQPVTDVAFDRLYPETIRKLPERFWTPIDIARRAARLFAGHDARRVLDVGAGVGKFCIVSALTADLELTGIEHREGLVTIADGILRAFLIPRVQMRLIAFITEGTQIRRILDHIGVDLQPPRMSPARGPPLWEDGDAQPGEGVQVEPDWDLAAQPAPDYEVDQRVKWELSKTAASIAAGSKLSRLSDKRALNLPWPNVFRRPKLVPYLASCG